jgi:hypothetical protein
VWSAAASSAEAVLRREVFMLHSVSAGNPLHLLVIDLPIVFVLVGTLLLIVARRWKDKAPHLIVPAVMLTVLGASLLYALVDNQAAAAARSLQVSDEVSQHRHDLIRLGVMSTAAAALLFASGLLVYRMRFGAAKTTASRVIVALEIIYFIGFLCLLGTAHRAASLADHLAGHVET